MTLTLFDDQSGKLVTGVVSEENEYTFKLTTEKGEVMVFDRSRLREGKIENMPIDYKKYPENWKKEIVPRILARDNHACKHCGLKNYQQVYSVKLKIHDSDGRYKYKMFWFSDINDALRANHFVMPDKVKVVLTIAHLDHDELNHEVADERLAALCQHCHLNYDAKEKYRRSLIKPTQP